MTREGEQHKIDYRPSSLPGVRARSSRPGPGALGLAIGIGALVAAEVAFLILIPRFVTVDGATHIGGAALLRDILTGAGGLHLEYVQTSTFPAPNLLPELVLALLLTAFDPVTAEKLLQVTYVVTLPLALLYALRGVSRANDWLVLLALPMTFTFTFHYGFYDFTFGVVLFLVAAGYLLRHTADPAARHAIKFGLLALLLYLTHIVPYLELVLFLAAIASWRLLVRRKDPAAARQAARRALPFAVALVPSLTLAASFFVRTGSGIPASFTPLVSKAAGVLSLSLGLATFDRLELVLSMFLALSLLALLVAAIRPRLPRVQLRDQDALLAFAAIAALASVLAPSAVESGGSYIPQRLALFPVYGFALWIAGSTFGRRLVAVVSVAWAGTALAFFVVRVPTYVELSRAVQEYVSIAPCMANQATVIQVNLARYPSGSLARTDPLTEETGRVAALTEGHDLSNFEGSFPFFLFRNRPENDPFRFLLTRNDGFESVPPGVDLTGYKLRPYGQVDYVIVFGRPLATATTLGSTAWSTLAGELTGDYRLVGKSSGGLVELYELTDSPAATAGLARRAVTDDAACHSSPAP